MKKKIFTLLSCVQLLFMTAYVSHAQPWLGDPVSYLEEGDGSKKNAYHLRVTALGDRALPGTDADKFTPSKGLFLAMDSLGRVVFRDGAYITAESSYLSTLSPLERLHETLWCINAKEFTGAHQGLFTFLNKHYGTDLSVNSNTTLVTVKGPTTAIADTWLSEHAKNSAGDKDSILIYKPLDGDSAVSLGGDIGQWLTGTTYLSRIPDTFALRYPHPSKDGWYLTFAVADTTTKNNPSMYSNIGNEYNNKGIVLVLAHLNDFNPTSTFYKHHLVRFSLYETVPRLLTPEGINKLLGTKGITIKSDLTVPDADNPFTKLLAVNSTYTQPAVSVGKYKIHALNANREEEVVKTDVTDAYYARLKTASNAYLVVKDGKNGVYYDGIGARYPKIESITTNDPDSLRGRADFRFVYYPSKGSVVINVRQLRIANFNSGSATDGQFYTDTVTQYMGKGEDFWTGGSGSGNSGRINLSSPGATWNNFYSHQHYNLFVLPQRINTGNYVVTAGGSLGSVSQLSDQFFIGSESDGCYVSDDRRSVKNNLYTITDSRGWYLTVPLYSGTYAPQWVQLPNETEALKSPAAHWFVTQYDGSEISKVELTNREFPNIIFDYVQLTASPKPFNKTWIKDNSHQSGDSYGSNIGGASVSVSGFKVIESPTYRNDPYLGYRSTDTDDASLANGSYTLEYYHVYTAAAPRYVGLQTAPTQDTLFYAFEDAKKTLFTLSPKDDPQGAHKYGIPASKYAAAGFNKKDETEIAELTRKSYALRISDYLTPDRNGRVMALSNTTDYVHGKEADVAEGKGKIPSFYLRYQFTVGEKDYYSLLQRINAGDFGDIAKKTGLVLTEKLWGNPDNAAADTFGVLQVAVDQSNLKIKAVSRFSTADAVSAFALAPLSNPLYRRLNDEGLANTAEPEGDAPRYLKFYQVNGAVAGKKNYLYEDRFSYYSVDRWGKNTSLDGTGIKFLGLTSESDGHDATLYVDTAFVNRGSGFELKPQYLLAVNPDTGVAFPTKCPTCAIAPVQAYRYTHARYLVNAIDSFRQYKGNADAVKSQAYIYGRYNRLIFVDAIHVGDTLWFLKEQTVLDEAGNVVYNPLDRYKEKIQGNNPYTSTSGEVFDPGFEYLNLDSVKKVNPATGFDGALSSPSERLNYAKDLNNNGEYRPYVFSFRYADQAGTSKARPFFIESETTNNTKDNPKYAPTIGGWVKYINGYLVISRQDETLSESITDAELFDVETGAPTANEKVELPSSGPQVVSGLPGSVTILNASGKRVVLSNILGQTILKSVLASDRAVLPAPSGVVIVSVEGEGTVKAIVK
jgi:hypothetical protein